MVRIPSLSRRSETRTPTPTRDENRDGRIDERDAQLTEDSGSLEPEVTDRGTDQTTYRSMTAADPDGDNRRGPGSAREPGEPRPDADADADERRATARAATARAVSNGSRPTTDRVAADRPTTDRVAADRPTTDREAGPATAAVPTGPHPRASLLASLSLIVGLAGLAFVLVGALAGYGIALGVVGALLAFGGLSATRRRHIAGRTDALFGLAFALGAVLLGILAFSGQYDWPSTDADLVSRLREWLDSQFVDRF